MNFRPLQSRSFIVRWFGFVVPMAAILLFPSAMIAQTCVPPPAGLVGWWQAEGNALDTVETNNGTLQGSAGYGPGEVGLLAFSFDGASGTMIVADSPSLRLTSQLTLEAWINTQRTNNGSPDQSIISKVGGAAGNNGYQMALTRGNVLIGMFNTPGQAWPGYTVSTPLPIEPGTWNHVAWTYDQSASKLYLNGQPVATNVVGPVTISATSANLHVSSDDGNNAYFAGLIDEATVYNRALSASEIAAIYNAGSAGKCPPPSPPFIASQPVSQWVTIGGNATFSVVAGGPAPLSYQWTWNGTNLAAATSASLTLTNVQLSQAGTYAVQVTNLYGSISSSNATLTVFAIAPTTFYVDVNSPAPTFPYTTWSTAATNIQDAVNAALAGDLVLVTNGFYQYGGQAVSGAANRVAVVQPMTIQSVGGPAVTIISGGPGVRCVYLTNGAVLAGFTLTNGVTLTSGDALLVQSGGGVWCQSSNVIVTNCVLAGNTANAYGGGAYQGTLTNCALTGNQAGYGGGAYGGVLNHCTLIGNSAYYSNGGGGDANGTLNDCTLVANTSGGWGGGAYNATLNRCVLSSNVSRAGFGGGGAFGGALNSCVLTGNQADVGGGAAFAMLTNCTLVGNTASTAGGGAVQSTLNNCIVYFNQSAWDANFNPACTLNYCCTTPLPSTGSGNFTSNPQLASDSHLSTGSPCRGAGSVAYATGTDIDGEAWLSPPSVGCDEYLSGSVTGALSVAISADYTNVATGYHANFTAIIGGRFNDSTWDFGDGVVVSNQALAAHAWTAAGDYPVTLTAYNDSNPGGISAAVLVHVAAQPVYYVALGNASPSAPYSSWATAATNIQDAVDAASLPGALVLVSNGMYQTSGRVMAGVSNRVAVPLPLILQGLNGAGVTAVNGSAAARGVYLVNGATLTGFTLTNGAAPNGAGVWCESSAVVVSNCVLVGNSASLNGGGAYQATLNNCLLNANSASDGGGAYFGVLNNCVLTNNTAIGDYGGGAGNCTLNNCLLSGNSTYAWGGGAMYCTLNNCLVTSNLADLGNDVFEGGGAAWSTLNNCTVTGNSLIGYGAGGAFYSTLNNCIVNDGNRLCTLNYCFTGQPLFVNPSGGNFRLQTNSHCINAGNNAYMVGTTDLDGRPRIVGGTVDVGAYEFQGPGMGEFIGWLQQYSLPTDGSADFADTDHDGLNSWQEWRAGTSPIDATSALKMYFPTNRPSGVSVSWQSVNTRTYYLQRSTNLLVHPAFSTIQSNLTGQAGVTFYTDTNAPVPGPAYYRVGVQ